MELHEAPSGDQCASANLDDWLRRQLGRRVNLVVIAAEAAALRQVDELISELASYSELRVIHPRTQVADQEGNVAQETLQRAAQEDADAILIWTERPLDAEDAASRLQHWLAEAEGLGLCDRAFIALIGSHVTRKSARGLGYEDGIPSATTSLQCATLVANEAIARDELRRRGSSPPCYL